MAKPSRLHIKSFKKKFRECLIQLRSMLAENGIALKQKIFLSNPSDGFKYQNNSSNENPSNVGIKNQWGQKDLQSILKERNDRIYHLESELEELKIENARFSDERKRVKLEVFEHNSSEILKQLIETKNETIAKHREEMENYIAKAENLEMQLQIEKSASEILKETNKSLSEITNKKQSPLYNREIHIDSQKIVDLEKELVKYKAECTALVEEVSILKVEKRMQDERIWILERSKKDYECRYESNATKQPLFNDDVPMNEMENTLMEELENITEAYDQISNSNKLISEKHSALLKEHAELQSSNISLINRLKSIEDSRQFIEKEKRKLADLKSTLLSEKKLFEERAINFEVQFSEKDKRISDYKILLTSLQSNVNLLESELNAVNLSCRNAQQELFETKSKFRSLQTGYDDIKKLCDTYKDICTSETDVVEVLEQYKKALRCSLCDTNVKNSVISKCMHAFCGSCLNDRLKARQRKCPSCQIDFGANDIKKLYF
ncbi:E3 ubiquitin-protein ligase bre1 [Glugoides intestinalis]